MITGLARTTSQKKVCLCGKRQVKHSMTDIQTGRVMHPIMVGTRIAYSTGQMTHGHTYSGMTPLAATFKDLYASK